MSSSASNGEWRGRADHLAALAVLLAGPLAYLLLFAAIVWLW
jgi:hypothetical protein